MSLLNFFPESDLKKTFIFIMLIFSFCFGETVQTAEVKQNANAAFKELAADTAKWQKTVSENTKKINSIRSSFKQVKNLSFLSQQVTSGGKFFFEKNGTGHRLKWQYTSPFVYTILIDGQKITMKDGNKVSSFDMSTSRVFEEINDIMVRSLNGTILSDSRNFTFSIKENGRSLMIEMVPVKGTPLNEYFKSIKMVMDTGDFTVNTLTMTESSGDFTELTFTDKSINGHIDISEFRVE